MQTIENYNFAGKKAFIRVDFNVPLNEQLEVTDSTRIRAAMPTLKKILSDGGSVIIGSHLGRPKSGAEDKFSLKHILPVVSELLGVSVQFANDCMGQEAIEKSVELKPGEALLLENLRFYAEEEGKPRGLPDDASDETKAEAKKEIKEKQKAFAHQLASYADVYVNDAFGTAHRAHASTALIADYFNENSKLFGYLMQNEIDAVEKVLKTSVKPVTAIIGGSKVSTKITIIKNLMTKIDNLLIVGGMAFTFSKAQGGKIGNSLCEDDMLDLANEILDEAQKSGVNIVLPNDTIAADKFAADANTQLCTDKNIPDSWMGLDLGPASIQAMSDVIKSSKTILWNGPAGVFEFEQFAHGSKALAEAIAEATANGAFSLIGGGDSVAAINKFNLADKVSYVSTGGGALLEFIEGQVLPGIKAIRGF
ncbi:MAG: phosphoglycerate kinase [Bacteroidales bacterium]|jgi:phosphoglycerate kinase|nr:phosphoglycerate kinase [Bacteroidales bacterium]